MKPTQIKTATRERFMQAAQKEMAKFERREIEFRKQDRRERAAELHIPLKIIECSNSPTLVLSRTWNKRPNSGVQTAMPNTRLCGLKL